MASLVSMVLLVTSALFDRRAGRRLRAAARRHRVPRRRLRAHRADPQHASPRRSTPTAVDRVRPRAQRAARRWAPRWRPLFVAIFVGLGFWWGLPRDVGRPARRPAPRQPRACRCARRAAPAARRAAARRGRSRAVLAVRRVRRALRHLRDDERQLVAARHDQRARRLDRPSPRSPSPRSGRWSPSGASCSPPIQRWFPTHRTYRVLPFVLVGAFVAIAALPDGGRSPGVARVRARRPRLLGAAAADDQLRPGGPGRRSPRPRPAA